MKKYYALLVVVMALLAPAICGAEEMPRWPGLDSPEFKMGFSETFARKGNVVEITLLPETAGIPSVDGFYTCPPSDSGFEYQFNPEKSSGPVKVRLSPGQTLIVKRVVQTASGQFVAGETKIYCGSGKKHALGHINPWPRPIILLNAAAYSAAVDFVKELVAPRIRESFHSPGYVISASASHDDWQRKQIPDFIRVTLTDELGNKTILPLIPGEGMELIKANNLQGAQWLKAESLIFDEDRSRLLVGPATIREVFIDR